MRFALVNETRCEAQPELIGICPACSAKVIAKCGTKRIWHWSHIGERNCDSWWERETAWHRAWKSLFPREYQEVGHVDHNGERHIADIKTQVGLVIEIQHSPIAELEMAAREAFYKTMVWIVDGTRLKRDIARFAKGLTLTSIGAGYYMTPRPEDCFPAVWLSRKVPVFFDAEGLAGFIDGAPAEKSQLWCLLPGRALGHAVIALVSRRQFAEITQQRAQLFDYLRIVQTVKEGLNAGRRAVSPLPPRPPAFRRPWRRRMARF